MLNLFKPINQTKNKHSSKQNVEIGLVLTSNIEIHKMYQIRKKKKRFKNITICEHGEPIHNQIIIDVNIITDRFKQIIHV